MSVKKLSAPPPLETIKPTSRSWVDAWSVSRKPSSDRSRPKTDAQDTRSSRVRHCVWAAYMRRSGSWRRYPGFAMMDGVHSGVDKVGTGVGECFAGARWHELPSGNHHMHSSALRTWILPAVIVC